MAKQPREHRERTYTTEHYCQVVLTRRRQRWSKPCYEHSSTTTWTGPVIVETYMRSFDLLDPAAMLATNMVLPLSRQKARCWHSRRVRPYGTSKLVFAGRWSLFRLVTNQAHQGRQIPTVLQRRKLPAYAGRMPATRFRAGSISFRTPQNESGGQWVLLSRSVTLSAMGVPYGGCEG